MHKLKNIRKMQKLLADAIEKLSAAPPHDIEFIQDSVVARFKILIESTWKIIKIYLENKEITEVTGSPKEILKSAFEFGLLNQQEYEALLSYVKLRNVASHIYDQPQYLLVVEAAKPALYVIQIIIDRLEKESKI